MNRNEFIRTSCSALGLGIVAQLASGCSTLKVYKTGYQDNEIRIPLSEFATEEIRLVRIPKLEYDILVRKMDDKTFSALLLKCTHQDWNLVAGKSKIHCTAHGSEFDWMGNVKVGPASSGLKRYQTRIENNTLILT